MTGGSGPPTLEQVAALAGVSRATVSRVVNGSPKVSPAVRAQVERAVVKLGYVPNRAARSLVTRRANSVALVVSEPHARFFSEPFFAGMVRGVSAALAETGVQLLLLISQDLPDGDGWSGTWSAATSTACCWPPCTPTTRCPAPWSGPACPPS